MRWTHKPRAAPVSFAPERDMGIREIHGRNHARPQYVKVWIPLKQTAQAAVGSLSTYRR